MSIILHDEKKKTSGAISKLEKQRKAKKRTNDTFLYMAPTDSNPDYGKCKSCANFTGHGCNLFGKTVAVKAEDSCGLYVPGAPGTLVIEKPEQLVTPIAAGFVKGESNCQNCISFDPLKNECQLFKTLNENFPTTFSLNISVKPEGSCNAFAPKPKEE